MSEVGGTEALSRRLPALDGLRAMTMVVVLAYHGSIPGVRGAFLGISQFFTLSGFLITSILLRSYAQHGTIQLRSFWTRRYRRLLPAAWLALGFAVVFGATVATQQQIDHLPGGIISSLAQVANWYFVLAKQSYVDLFAAPSPVQQFWSLAVEEQLYLVVPLVTLAVLRWTRSTRALGWTFAIGAAASTTLMAVLYQTGASLDRLYYGTDTRAAELLVGAALAVVLHARPPELGPRGRKVLGAAGVVAFLAILWAWNGVSLSDPALWHGGFLAFSLVSAVLIVSILGTRGPMTVLFGWGPLPAIGRITYGLYLFHWPIFLWLTPDRTGLTVWPLFALRLAVTFAVAIASYHLLEMPIRNRTGASNRHHLRWVAIPTAAALILGVIVVGGRKVESQFAGLDRDSVAAPMPADDDRPLRVLMISDDRGAPIAAELTELSRDDPTIELRSAEQLTCRGLETDAPEPTCVNWRREWGGVIDEFDPDVVLFNVAEWKPQQIATLARSNDLDAQIDAARRTLDAGMEVLASRGATIVWNQPAVVNSLTAARLRAGPFYQGFDRVAHERNDIRVAQGSGQQLLDTVRIHRRRATGDDLRILLVGDSSSLTMGYGLERWADERGGITVWSAGVAGCGLANDGVTLDATDREVPVDDRCRTVVQDLTTQVDQFEPDLVFVLSTRFDLQARRLDTWDAVVSPGDQKVDDYLVDAYTTAYDALSARGATVVWFRNPCPPASAESGFGEDPHPLRDDTVVHVNDVVLGRLAQQRPDIRFFDLYGVLCPDGQYHEDLPGIDDVRPDGVHFTPDSSSWLADNYAQQMIDAGSS